jgi:soluble lytic murein transglycosylase-like protein
MAQPPLPAHKPSTKKPSSSPALIKSTAIPKTKKKPIGTGLFLSKSDRALYQDIFKAQDRADWKTANAKTEKLKDLRLRGYIVYQRLMHPSDYVSSYEELAGWLDQYPALAGAHDIYKLAQKRKPAGASPLKKPIENRIIYGSLRELNPEAPRYSSTKKRSAAQTKLIHDLEKAIRGNLRQDRITISNDQLKQSEAKIYMDDVEYDRLRAQIAAGYLYIDMPEKALELSLASLNRSGEKAPLSGWVAGLTSWTEKDYANAYKYFQTVALSDYTSTWTKAAGAYWASRAALKLGQFDKVSEWLNIAAEYNRTFYGVLAIRALGRDVRFNWALPAFKQDHEDKILSYTAGRRAFLLIQAGQKSLASRELLKLHPNGDDSLETALITFSAKYELPSFQIQFAHLFKQDDDSFYDSALYPLAAWKPKNDWEIERAFIHAIVRQESRFDPRAENSYSNAMGLMQILPSTANGVVGSKQFSNAGKYSLKDPIINITVGQRYLLKLQNKLDNEDDLIRLAIAFNAGPGNLRKWEKELHHIEDPLLFMEMLPYAETRAYVERVMSHYWIYKMRLGEESVTLNQLASGR